MAREATNGFSPLCIPWVPITTTTFTDGNSAGFCTDNETTGCVVFFMKEKFLTREIIWEVLGKIFFVANIKTPPAAIKKRKKTTKVSFVVVVAEFCVGFNLFD